MKLSDIMSHMQLSTYPQVALVLFLAVFANVVVYVWRMPRALMLRRANLPLEGD